MDKLLTWLKASVGYGSFWILYALGFIILILGIGYTILAYDCHAAQYMLNAYTELHAATCYVQEGIFWRVK